MTADSFSCATPAIDTFPARLLLEPLPGPRPVELLPALAVAVSL